MPRNLFLGASIRETLGLGFSFPPDPDEGQTQVLLARRKGSKPFYEGAVSCFSLMVLNFFLHELLEGGANDEVLCGVI